MRARIVIAADAANTLVAITIYGFFGTNLIAVFVLYALILQK